MVLKILHNNYSKRATLTNIRKAKDRDFYIWTFTSDSSKYVGFTSDKAYYGSKTHLWYSLLVGYFLPEAYTINFDNVVSKECIITIDSKKIVRSIVPIKVDKPTDKEKQSQSEPDIVSGPDESLFR